MFPNFLSPLAAWLFLLIAPLVVLYFLKLRRDRQEVPSLVLWRQVLNDNRVNSPFQRFRKNLLLLLQLLLLIALILAAMQPFMKGNLGDAKRLPIMIDHSASMAAFDKKGGITRLEAAKRQVRDMIEGLGENQQFAILSFSNRTRVLCEFTNNKRILRDAVDSIEIEDVTGDIEQPMEVAKALHQTQPFDELLLLSDGNFPGKLSRAANFRLDYQPVGPGGANWGITFFNAQRARKGQWDVFALIEGSHVEAGLPSESRTATVELFRNGESEGVEELVVAQGQSQRLVFTVDAEEEPVSLEMRLTIKGFDSLESDNIAYLDLQPARELRVFCPPSLATYRLALRNLPDVKLYPADGQPANADQRYDLLVSDKAADIERDARVRFFVDVRPDATGDVLDFKRGENSGVIKWRREHPLLRYINLNDLVLMDTVDSREGVLEGDYVNRGFEVLIQGDKGPLLLVEQEERAENYYMLFHSDRSTLPYRVAFPLMIDNLVEIGLDRSGLFKVPGRRTGVFEALPAQLAVDYTIEGPGNFEHTTKSNDRGSLLGVPAPRVGRYRFSPDNDVAELGVSLLNSDETSLKPVEQIILGTQEAVTGTDETKKADYPWWRLLVMIALGLLAFEWWYYNRKVGGFFARSAA